MSRAQELVDAHFDGYVGPLLAAAGVEDKVIALCAFMYKSSGIHFYKHAQEDAVEAARGAFANDAAHRDEPQVEVNVGETWIIQKANATALTTVVINDISEHTVVMSPQGAQYLGKELQRKQDIRFVERVKDTAAHKAPSLCDDAKEPFTFPPALKWMGKTGEEYVAKLLEEVNEVGETNVDDPRSTMMEAFDVIHAAETMIRTIAENTGINPAEVAAETVAKNHSRGYYNARKCYV